MHVLICSGEEYLCQNVSVQNVRHRNVGKLGPYNFMLTTKVLYMISPFPVIIQYISFPINPKFSYHLESVHFSQFHFYFFCQTILPKINKNEIGLCSKFLSLQCTVTGHPRSKMLNNGYNYMNFLVDVINQMSTFRCTFRLSILISLCK